MTQYAFRLGMNVLFWFVLICPITMAEDKQPTYVCRTSTSPIIIDGKLNEPSWQHAQAVKVIHPFQPEGATNLPSTTARLLWDESTLYIAWKAEDSDVKSYSDKQDDVLEQGDVVGLFIRPGMHNRVYHEFNIAPNGAVLDARYPSRISGGRERFKRWNSGARIATHIDGTDGQSTDTDNAFTVEAAIPLAAFVEAGTIEAGTAWTFMLCRCDHSHTMEKPLLFSSLPGKLDPTHGFHSYELYQPIIFETQLSAK